MPAGLSTQQMQAIATEFNYSETTFVLPPRDPAQRRRGAHLHAGEGDAVRRPSQCRHRLRAGRAVAKEPKPRLLFEEKAGLVPVDIVREQGRVVSTELTAPQPLSRLAEVSAAEVAACISLDCR